MHPKSEVIKEAAKLLAMVVLHAVESRGEDYVRSLFENDDDLGIDVTKGYVFVRLQAERIMGHTPPMIVFNVPSKPDAENPRKVSGKHNDPTGTGVVTVEVPEWDFAEVQIDP